MNVAALLDRLEKVRRTPTGHLARCPAHPDKTPSLSIREADDGKLLVHCFAGCDHEQVVRSLGLAPHDLFPDRNGSSPESRRLIAAHGYHDAQGHHLFDVRRFSTDPRCLPFLPGAHTAGIGDTARPLYRLPIVLGGIRLGHTIYLCEGESDADALEAAGVIATTNPFGAGPEKWLPEHRTTLQDAHVVVVQDRDDAGRRRGEHLLRELKPVVASVRLVEPVVGKDAKDHIRAGHTVAELAEITPENASVTLGNREPTEETNSPAGLPFKPIGEALAETPKHIDWVWHGCLAPAVKTLFASKPKIGKSTKMFGLLRALTAGDEVLEFLGLTVAPTSVLLLSEEPAAALHEKAVRFNLDLSSVSEQSLRRTEEKSGPSVHLLMRSQALGVPWEDVVDQAIVYALQHQIGVLVIDTLDKWAGFRADDENKTGALLEIMEPIERAVAAGLAVLIITHHRKSGGEYGEGVRGGNALVGAVDVVLELERLPESADESRHGRILRGLSRFADTPETIVFRLDFDVFEVLDDVATLKADAELEATVAAVRSLEGPVTAEDVGQSLDLQKSAAHSRLQTAHSKGRLVRTGEGKKGDPYMFEVAE